MSFDAGLEIARRRADSVAEQMGVILAASSRSPNIKERLDCSAAVFNSAGVMVAQAPHVPVHLGSMPESVRASLDLLSGLAPGDAVILNDPFAGGTHLNDITVVMLARDGIVATRAHHTDVGGTAAGSLPADAETIDDEGIRIPPTVLRRDGVMNSEVVDALCRASRTPEERVGDLAAQVAACDRGLVQLGSLDTTTFDRLLEYSRTRARNVFGEWEGSAEFTDTLDSGTHIVARVSVSDGAVTVDLQSSDDSTAGPFNAPRAVAVSAAHFALRTVLPADLPNNAGVFADVEVLTRPGSVCDAVYPSAVGAGNLEVSQRVCDAVLGALSGFAEVGAAGQGTMNSVAIGGDGWSYYETIAGGQGAGPWGPGMSGIHVNMTNTRNTPIESLERSYPLKVTRYELRRGSGGEGRHCGGDGVIRELRLEADATVTILADRRVHAPWGLHGGSGGACGRDFINGERVSARTTVDLRAGDVVRIETPGGGGWGRV